MNAMSEFELTDREWSAIRPVLPTKWRGIPRVDDRRVLNGIFWVLRSGLPWRRMPQEYGPFMTCYNRYIRWHKAGIWDQIMTAIAEDYDAASHGGTQTGNADRSKAAGQEAHHGSEPPGPVMAAADALCDVIRSTR